MDIQLSSNFKKMTSKAIFAIIIFILVYLILLLLGIVLTALCIYGGISLIIAIPKFLTIVLGIGLASLGIMIFIFLIKFLFKEHTVDRSHLTEISRSEYPELFNLIEDIAKEAKTRFPKRVYLSSDVNAAVFYDSSFWSMFFPIRKNLQIGLGLVSTVTEQELKAILAHEFGHFSQRTMSVGSYVHNVNQVIFNMLYDNDSFDGMIQAWANLTGYFSIFVIIAVKIIHGIQWILQKMYGFVNIRYMALSREMEFHADEVAANIAGSKPLEDSLLRLDLSQRAYNWTFNFYENRAGDNVISKNIFKDQFVALKVLAKENKIPFENGYPKVSLQERGKYNLSKINIEDQWASHPTTEERVIALQKLNIVKAENKTNPAISLFSNGESLEEKVTNQIFYRAVFLGNAISLNVEEFEKELLAEVENNKFPDEYNEYYDNKNPNIFDLENINDFESEATLDTLFGKEIVNSVYKLIAIRGDKNILESISRKEIKLKTFDYEGRKYKVKEANDLMSKLDKEIEDLEDKITKNDINIYRFFYTKAQAKGKEQELKAQYIHFFEQDDICNKRFHIYNTFIGLTNQLRVASQQEQVEAVFREISDLEIKLKAEIKSLMEDPALNKEISQAIKDNFDKYLSRNWSYSANELADQEYLNVLFSAINNFNYLTSRSYFVTKLSLLRFQIAQL